MTLCYKTRLSIFARPCAFQLDRKENKETFHRHIHRLSAEGLCSQKGQTYTLLLDGGLVKGCPWRIWVIIDTLTLHVVKGELVGLRLWYVNDPQANQESLGETTLSVSEYAVPNHGKVGNQVPCPHFRCFGSYFDVFCWMYPVYSGFSFNPTSSSSIILIDLV